MPPTGGGQGRARGFPAVTPQAGGEETRKAKSWPATPQALSGAQRRISANLRAVGIGGTFSRTGGGGGRRVIAIGKTDVPPPPSSPPPQAADSSTAAADPATAAGYLA